MFVRRLVGVGGIYARVCDVTATTSARLSGQDPWASAGRHPQRPCAEDAAREERRRRPGRCVIDCGLCPPRVFLSFPLPHLFFLAPSLRCVARLLVFVFGAIFVLALVVQCAAYTFTCIVRGSAVSLTLVPRFSQTWTFVVIHFVVPITRTRCM